MLTYENELSDIFNELNHYRPPNHDSADREYVLMDQGYKSPQGLQPKFEGIRSQLYNKENTLLCDNTFSQLLIEESHLKEMKGSGDNTTCVINNSKAATPNQDTNVGNMKKGSVKPKETLWCTYYKRREHTKEIRWKLYGRPPQAHKISQPLPQHFQSYHSQGPIEGQLWMQKHTPQGPNFQNHTHQV